MRHQPPPSPPVAAPLFARLHRVRSTGLLYGDLHPGTWYRVESHNPRTLWLVTESGVIDVASQDFDLSDTAPMPAPIPLRGR